MADIYAIVLPDGTSYNIKDTTYSAGTGISLSGTTINHSNSITEQTTQAIYPIAIDAQGHITSYGNAVTVSDTKVTQTYAAATGYTYWRPLVIGYSSNSSETGTPSTQTNSTYTFKTLLVQPSSGTIRINNLALANGNYKTTLSPTTLTENRTITIPNNTGTLALTSDIPSAATATPIMDGTAAVGSSTKYAREDHVHPETPYVTVIYDFENEEIIDAPTAEEVYAIYQVYPAFSVRFYSGEYDGEDLITHYMGESIINDFNTWEELDGNDETVTHWYIGCVAQLNEVDNTESYLKAVIYWNSNYDTVFYYNYLDTSSGPTNASIDSNGLISFLDSNNVTLFTLQLPLYNGGIS